MNRKIILACTILLVLYFWSCSENKNNVKESILAKVGDRIITENDFIERAELTPRQPYCSSNKLKDKAIILNTLIAEKVLGIQVQNDSQWVKNERLQALFKGRKEQFMRQLLFKDKALKIVKVDSNEIMHIFNCAGRKYVCEYVKINEKQVKEINQKFSKKSLSKSELFNSINPSKPKATREIAWKDQDNPDIVRETLFSKKYFVGNVIGPLKTDYNEYLLLKIKSYTEDVNFGGIQSIELLQNVKNTLIKIKANQLWNNYVRKIMKGVKVEFNPKVYLKVFSYFAYWVYNKDKTKKESNPNTLLENKGDFPNSFTDAQLMQMAFCKINNTEWTVADFKKVLLSHPLVMRKNSVKNKEELLEQFKLSVVDLIRDKFVTDEAYKLNYDKRESVQREYYKWHDAYAAIFYRDRYLKSLKQNIKNNLGQSGVIGKPLQTFIDKMVNKYRNKITINKEIFDKIKLTSSSMYAININEPFLLVAPNFPVLTDSQILNYKIEY